MKTLELTKQQARHLVMSLEGNGNGFNIGKLRKLSSLIDKLCERITEFSNEIERIARTNSGDSAVRDDLLDTLTNTDGQDPVDCILEDAEYDLLKELWGTLQFSANRHARIIVLSIDRAITGARTPEKEAEKEKVS